MLTKEELNYLHSIRTSLDNGGVATRKTMYKILDMIKELDSISESNYANYDHASRNWQKAKYSKHRLIKDLVEHLEDLDEED